jgi:hypothetical protein
LDLTLYQGRQKEYTKYYAEKIKQDMDTCMMGSPISYQSFQMDLYQKLISKELAKIRG